MEIEHKNKKLVSYLIILLGLFILLFFSKPEFDKMQEKREYNKQLTLEYDLKRKELDEKSKLKKELEELLNLEENKTGKITDRTNETNSGTSLVSLEQVRDIGKIINKFNESDIINYIYDQVKNNNNHSSSKIIVNNISFNKIEKNDLGFKEVNINLNVRVNDKDTMIRFLDYFIDNDSKYKFFINNFTYPKENSLSGFDVNIPLVMYYL